MPRTRASSPPTVGGGMVTGTYTGNGAATQAIIGVGFQPRFVRIWIHTDNYGNTAHYWKSSLDGQGTFYFTAGLLMGYRIDHIRSLDADGFTVGNGTGHENALNQADVDYTYVAFP